MRCALWNRKISFQVLVVVLTLAFAGCTGQKTLSVSNSSTPPATTGAPAVSPSAPTGGGSDGGGNLIDGKPIEDWAFSLEKNQDFREAYELLLGKVIAKLRAEKSPETHERAKTLANFLQSTLKRKTWYFVPGPLKKVAESLTGSVVPTNQGALQGHERVWVDLDLWKNMDPQARATLLLHEAVMGLKILQFQSSRTQCEWAYLQQRQSCNEALDNKKQNISLTSKDYSDVQQTVLTLKTYLETAEPLNTRFWESMDDQWSFTFPWFDQPLVITRTQFVQSLQTALQAHDLPTNGLSEANNAHVPCAFAAAFNSDSSRMSFRMGTNEFSVDVVGELATEWAAPKRKMFQDTGRVVTIATKSAEAGSSPPRYFYLSFVLSGPTWQGLYINEMACLGTKCNQTTPVSLKDGLQVYCSRSQ